MSVAEFLKTVAEFLKNSDGATSILHRLNSEESSYGG